MTIPRKHARVLRGSRNKAFVLRRNRDGRYFAVNGWSVEWIDIPDHRCPVFRDGCGEWHINLLKRMTMGYELVQFDNT